MKFHKSDNAVGVGRIAVHLVWSLLLCDIPLVITAMNQDRAIGQVLHELTTTYEGGWVQDGIMFDVRTDTVLLDSAIAVDITTSIPDGISVNGINFLTPVEGMMCVELYTKAGTFEDGAFDQAQWTFLGSFSLMGQGPDSPTSIPPGSFDFIKIELGQTQAFYVTTQDETLRYTALDPAESVTGDVYVKSNAHYTGPKTATGRNGKRLLQSSDGLAVEILTGVSKNYPFAESWPHRVFNGALLYTIGIESSTSFLSSLSDDQIEEASAVKRGSVTCDKPAILNLSPTSSPSTLESTVKKLATTLHGGLKQAGMMFDILVPSVANGGPPEGLTVLALEMSTFLTDEVCVEVYSKSGTYVGFEQDIVQNADGTWSSDTWKVLGAATATGRGETTPTHLPIGALDPVFVAAGERRAFYITMTQPEMRYTQPKFGEKRGDVFATSADGHLEILVGSAVAYPFEEIWENRIYNGAVVYFLGDTGGEMFNEMNSTDRERTCPVITESAESSPYENPIHSVVVIEKPIDVDPTLSEKGEEEVTTSKETGSTNVDEVIPDQTTDTGGTDTQDNYQAAGYTGRLADLCPESGDDTATRDVVIPYNYAFITNTGADVSAMIKEMENALHNSLVSNKCPAVGERMRLLQSSSQSAFSKVSYKGFNSNPADQASGEKCGTATEVEGKECHLVSGGVTAVVRTDVDVAQVTFDIESYLESIFSDRALFQSWGMQQVLYEPPKNISNTVQQPSIEAADGKSQDRTSNTNEPKSLSTHGIIIIAVFGCALVAILLALLAKRVRKERRIHHAQANSLELFQEFPDEADRVTFSRYGIHATSDRYDENLAPKSIKGRSRTSPAPSSLQPQKKSSYGPAAVILNDADDISLFSGERSSKYRFAGPILVGQRVRTDSTGSAGSRSSKSSKKSVEFLKAGQSFNSVPTITPEDTVDL